MALAVFLLANYALRAARFSAAPTVPLQEVQGHFDRHFPVWASLLNRPDAEVLIPDIGGALWSGRLHIVDLAGLIDRRIGSLLGRDRRAIAELVLEDLRPTFVSMHGNHAWWSGLPEDPRFHRDYAGIATWIDSVVREERNVDIVVGHFVRRDALNRVSIETLRAAVR